MNILITAPSLDVKENVSGISAVVTTIIKNNPGQNYIHFIAGRKDNEIGIIGRVKAVVNSYLKLNALLNSKAIHLMHLNLAMNPKSLYRDYFIFKIAKLSQTKVLVHLHGGKYLLHKPGNIILRKISQSILNNADALICLSNLERQAIEQVYNVKPIEVLENTIDDGHLCNNQKRSRKDNTRVLFMGRLHESKGVKVILDSIKVLMAKEYANLHFVFCGAGPLENEVLSSVNRYPDNVSYRGVVSGDEKTKVLQSTDIFILPSLYGEGLPMSLIEAMACGLVPVITNDGSMQSLVSNGETGIMVEKNNVWQLSDALARLHNDRNELCKISISAHKYIAENFSISRYISSLNEIYMDMVS